MDVRRPGVLQEPRRPVRRRAMLRLLQCLTRRTLTMQNTPLRPADVCLAITYGLALGLLLAAFI